MLLEVSEGSVITCDDNLKDSRRGFSARCGLQGDSMYDICIIMQAYQWSTDVLIDTHYTLLIYMSL